MADGSDKFLTADHPPPEREIRKTPPNALFRPRRLSWSYTPFPCNASGLPNETVEETSRIIHGVTREGGFHQLPIPIDTMSRR